MSFSQFNKFDFDIIFSEFLENSEYSDIPVFDPKTPGFLTQKQGVMAQKQGFRIFHIFCEILNIQF